MSNLQLGAAWPKYHRNEFNIGQSPFASTGNNLLWKFDAGGAIYSSPVIDKYSNVYIASLETLYALDVSQLVPFTIWQFVPGSYIVSSSPVLGTDGTIYIGSYDNKLHAIASDGKSKWSFTTSGNM